MIANHYTAGPADECWPWTGQLVNGYARYRGATAHRLVYESRVSPIPEGLELDHTCRNRGCVNPGHLEPVTHAENQRRKRQANGEGEYSLGSLCRNGHLLDEANLYQYRSRGRIERTCRTCNRASHERRKLGLAKPARKLMSDDIAAILNEHPTVGTKALAERYGVSGTYVRYLVAHARST